MALPLLTFNLVGPAFINSGSQSPEFFTAAKPKSHVLYTLSQLVASSSFWQVDVFDTTGSMVEALVLKPQPSKTVTPNMRVIVTMNASGAAGGASTAQIMQNRSDADTPDAATAGMLQVGFAPDISNAPTWVTGSWNSDRPWGSTVRWSKYWSVSAGDKGAIEQMYLIESSETLLIGAKGRRGNNAHYAWHGGAIMVSFDSGSGEQDQRVWGVTTTGGQTFAPTVHTAVIRFPFGDSGNSNQDHTGIFIVSGGVQNLQTASGQANSNIWMLAKKELQYATTLRSDGVDRATASTSEENVIGAPIIMRDAAGGSTVGSKALGYARQCYIVDNAPGLQAVFSGTAGGAFIGYLLSSDVYASNDAVFFCNVT